MKFFLNKIFQRIKCVFTHTLIHIPNQQKKIIINIESIKKKKGEEIPMPNLRI